MDHYLNLLVRSDPEFPATVLLSALYAKLHRALVAHAQQGGAALAVSFPQHTAHGLGACLRLHGDAATLAALLSTDWLAGMRDHLDIGPVSPVPADAQHRVVRRVQVQSSPERLRRRLMRRHALDATEAAARIPDSAARRTTLPYVLLRSASTGQQFPLYVEHGPPQPNAIPGPFNTYGLSQTATIPWF